MRLDHVKIFSILYEEYPWHIRFLRACAAPVMILRLYGVARNLSLSVQRFHHWVSYRERRRP